MSDQLDDLARELIQNSVWAAAPVDVEPEVRLSSWRVYAVRGQRHFVGYNLILREGRVSSAIQFFDPKTRRGVTRSGRVYELVGSSGWDPDADWVFGVWLQAQGLSRKDAVEVPPEEFLGSDANQG